MHLRTSLLFSSFLLLAVSTAVAQQSPADTGNIVLVEDSKIRQALEKHIEINSKAPVEGYRIKIHFGADKTKAKEVKARFVARFPGVPAYEKYDQPNFNIRVGDFRTKLDAYKFLKEVQAEFPSAFIVQDDIEFPSIEPEPAKPEGTSPESLKQNR